MSAYGELLETGRLGEAGWHLLYRTVRAVAFGYNFPPPPGGWTDEAISDAAHEFLRHHRTPKRLADLTVRAVDDDTFERMFHKSVVNFFRDLSRDTDFGALVRRVNEVLRKSERFEQAGTAETWTLTGGPTERSRASEAQIAAATVDVPVAPQPRWRSERRRAPLTDFASMERLLDRILTVAAGSLPTATIARVVSTRIDVIRVPLTVDVDVFEHVADPTGAADHEQVLSKIRAKQIFDSLTDRQKILLATWERPVRNLSEIVDVKHSQASVLRQQLATELRQAVVDDDDREEVIRLVNDHARSWLSDWTTGHVPPFATNDER